MVDLSKITTNNRALFLAYDQGIEHGPSDFDDESIDPNYVLSIALEGKFNAVIFQKGIAEKYYDPVLHKEIPLIVKLNGKTNLVKDQDPYSPLLCTVSEAINLGAVAVGYTIYVGSESESKMTKEFADVVRDAHQKNIPVIGWMYPRGHALRYAQGKQNKGEITAYAARMGLELGADIVKINYPGSLDFLKWTVKSAGKTKVVVAGGPKEKEEDFLKLAKDIIEAGAIGMAVGRNIWQSSDPIGITDKLKKIIFGV